MTRKQSKTNTWRMASQIDTCASILPSAPCWNRYVRASQKENTECLSITFQRRLGKNQLGSYWFLVFSWRTCVSVFHGIIIRCFKKYWVLELCFTDEKTETQVREGAFQRPLLEPKTPGLGFSWWPTAARLSLFLCLSKAKLNQDHSSLTVPWF